MSEKGEEFDSMVGADSDLVAAVEEALRRRGFLNKLKAEMRKEVFHALEDRTVVLPDKPPDVLLASELIREFLMLFNLNSTLSVFCEEFGQPSEMAVDRSSVGFELGVNSSGSDEKIPLLILLIQLLKKNREGYLKNANDSIIVENDED